MFRLSNLFKQRIPKKVHRKHKGLYSRYMDNNQELEGLVERLNADREFSNFVYSAGELEICRDNAIYEQWKSQRNKLVEEGENFILLWLSGLVDMPKYELCYNPSYGLCIHDWKKTNRAVLMECRRDEDIEELLGREMDKNAIQITGDNIQDYFPGLTAKRLKENLLSYIEKYSVWASWTSWQGSSKL